MEMISSSFKSLVTFCTSSIFCSIFNEVSLSAKIFTSTIQMTFAMLEKTFIVLFYYFLNAHHNFTFQFLSFPIAISFTKKDATKMEKLLRLKMQIVFKNTFHFHII